MKRSIFTLAALAMVLSGCSSSKEEPAKTPAAAPKHTAKKGKGNKAPVEQPHVNPWAKEAPAGSAQAAAPASAKPHKKGGKKAVPEAPHSNPWARDSAGSQNPV